MFDFHIFIIDTGLKKRDRSESSNYSRDDGIATAPVVKKRTVWQQKVDMDNLKVEYKTKLQELTTQMNLISSAANGIQTVIQQNQKVTTEQDVNGITGSPNKENKETNDNNDNNDNNDKESLTSLLNKMLHSSLLQNNTDGKKKEKDTEEKTEEKFWEKLNKENKNQKRKSIIIESLLYHHSQQDIFEEQAKTHAIVQQVESMFQTLSVSLNDIMKVAQDNNSTTVPAAEVTAVAETNANDDNTTTAAPTQLELNKSSEQLLSGNNIRVTAAKFKIELSKGERKRLSTLSRVKTLREARIASTERPTNLLLQSIHKHLQKEQDFIEQSDTSSSLRREDENGQIIISTLSNIIYDVDQDVDSEDEELNQSRLDMKRIVGDSVRFSGGGSSRSSSRNKKENSVRVPQTTTQ